MLRGHPMRVQDNDNSSAPARLAAYAQP